MLSFRRRNGSAPQLAAAWGLGLLLAGCAGSPRAPTPAPVPAEASPPPPESPSTRSADAPLHTRGLQAPRVRAEALSILAEIAQARELPLTREVLVDVIDRRGIRAFARESLYEESSPEEIRMLGKIEASLGILPLDADPEEVLLDLLEEGVLGFYDPKRRTLFVGNFVPQPMLSMVVGHEIAHGLQDMHFDLQRFQHPLQHRSDAESARRFLIEGEAQAAYLAWLSGEEGLGSIEESVWRAMGDQVLDFSGMSPYPILARSLQMPYTDGTATVAHLVLSKGWSAVTDLYANLPQTTEQMLHLDKLLSMEPAIALHLPPEGLSAVLGRPAIWHDEVGEATWLAMVAEVEPATSARRCAAGWGGDTLLAFDDGKNAQGVPTVVVASAWDTELDAREFETCARHYIEEVVGVPKALLQRRGSVVLFATQLPPETDPKAIAKVVWRDLQVGRASGGTA